MLAQTNANVSPVFKKEKYTLKWKQVKDFNLVLWYVSEIAMVCYN